MRLAIVTAAAGAVLLPLLAVVPPASAQAEDCTILDPVTMQCGADVTVPSDGSGPGPGSTPDGGAPSRPSTPPPPVQRLNAPCPSGWEPVDPAALDANERAAIAGMAAPQRSRDATDCSGPHRPTSPFRRARRKSQPISSSA